MIIVLTILLLIYFVRFRKASKFTALSMPLGRYLCGILLTYILLFGIVSCFCIPYLSQEGTTFVFMPGIYFLLMSGFPFFHAVYTILFARNIIVEPLRFFDKELDDYITTRFYGLAGFIGVAISFNAIFPILFLGKNQSLDPCIEGKIKINQKIIKADYLKDSYFVLKDKELFERRLRNICD